MKTISSRHNPIVDAFRELADAPDPAGRRLLLDGVHLVQEAVNAGADFEVVAVAAARAGDGEIHALIDVLRDTGVETLTVTEPVLAAVSPVRTPSGLVAIVRRQAWSPAQLCDPTDAFLVVAVDVQDPGNVGGLIRVAEAGGASGVMVCGASASPFGWKAVRGSMGSVLRLPVVAGLSTDGMLHALQASGVTTIASAARNGDDPDVIDWSGKVALLLGAEGAGLEDSVLDASDRQVTIPMSAPVESLNVATAGGILIYAARRQRGASAPSPVSR
jgi:TrmH family RNA methyltransferase